MVPKSLFYTCIILISLSSVSINILAAPIRNSRPVASYKDSEHLLLDSEIWHTQTWGTLNLKQILGEGADGKAYDLKSKWSVTDKAYPGGVVAKKYKHKTEGRNEIENLRIVKELIDSGMRVATKELWAIMPKKPGKSLHHLESYKAVAKDITKCYEYMGRARNAIVEESKRYLLLPGAPEHDDLHQWNVLFEENGNGLLVAHLIDWGQILLNTKKGKKANWFQRYTFARDFKKRLAKGYQLKPDHDIDGSTMVPYGYDFSDENNCLTDLAQWYLNRITAGRGTKGAARFSFD